MRPIMEFRKKNSSIVIRIYKLEKEYILPEAVSPRETSNFGLMACFHKKHYLPNETNIRRSQFKTWGQLEVLLREKEDAQLLYPVYLSEHPVRLSIRDCDDKNAQQVGFIFARRDRIKSRKLSEEEVLRILEKEIRDYNHFLNCEVYFFEIVDVFIQGNYKVEDPLEISPYFYGSDFEENGLFRYAGIDLDNFELASSNVSALRREK